MKVKTVCRQKLKGPYNKLARGLNPVLEIIPVTE